MELPQKFILDTNVPLTANNALSCPEDSEDWRKCALNCIELLESVVRTKEGLVLDSNGKIFEE